MSYRSAWTTLSARIGGFVNSGNAYMSVLTGSGDPGGVARRTLLPAIEQLYDALRDFAHIHSKSMPEAAQRCLAAYIEKDGPDWKGSNPDATAVAPRAVAALSIFLDEMQFHLADSSVYACRLTERALSHLQRLIVVDHAIRSSWQAAYTSGETDCEKLGAIHLLQHGIWSFKAHTATER